MTRSWILTGLLLPAVFAATGQGQSRARSGQPAAPPAGAPQRTIFTTPAGVRSDSDPTSASAMPAASDTALEKYREMWRKMTPAQQKAFLDSGGYTLEQYERMLKPKESTSAVGGGVDPQRKINPAMEQLNRSLQNLDTVRDANLGRVQSRNCPPEVAARIQDLEAKLKSYDTDRNGVPEGTSSRAPSPNAESVDPLLLAGDWYKPAATPAAADQAARQNTLLAGVLPSAASPAKRETDDPEIIRTKAELEQLSGACAAPAR